MYKNPARWEFIQRAVELSKVPIIGNGDIWQTSDIKKMIDETGCHGVMVARGALRSPWMAKDFKAGEFNLKKEERVDRLKTFMFEYRAILESEKITERGLLKQSKSVTRFIADGIEGFEGIRRQLVLCQSVSDFYSIIEEL